MAGLPFSINTACGDSPHPHQPPTSNRTLSSGLLFSSYPHLPSITSHGGITHRLPTCESQTQDRGLTQYQSPERGLTTVCELAGITADDLREVSRPSVSFCVSVADRPIKFCLEVVESLPD